MRHLDDELLAAARGGEPGAREVEKAVRRMTRAVEVLMRADICPGCIWTQVEHVLQEHGVEVVEDGS